MEGSVLGLGVARDGRVVLSLLNHFFFFYIWLSLQNAHQMSRPIGIIARNRRGPSNGLHNSLCDRVTTNTPKSTDRYRRTAGR